MEYNAKQRTAFPLGVRVEVMLDSVDVAGSRQTKGAISSHGISR